MLTARCGFPRAWHTDVIGRAAVNIHPIAAQEPASVTTWLPLGMGHWSDDNGCVS